MKLIRIIQVAIDIICGMNAITFSRDIQVVSDGKYTVLIKE